MRAKPLYREAAQKKIVFEEMPTDMLSKARESGLVQNGTEIYSAPGGFRWFGFTNPVYIKKRFESVSAIGVGYANREEFILYTKSK